MFTERTSVGLDVHARSVAAAAIDGVTGELWQAKLPPGQDRILSWVSSLPGPLAVAYEAGPTGFGLHRALESAGIRSVVAAPSKLQRPSGDRVKTDARDAVHLARLLRLDEITPVTVPTVSQEAARDLVRAREDCRGDLMRARHRLSKLLLRHGIVYDEGRAWTGKHDRWLAHQRLSLPSSQAALEAEYETVLQVKARRDRLDAAIEQLATDSEFDGVVTPARMSARGQHTDRLRSRGRDRRLDPVHREQHRLFRRSGALRVLLRAVPGAGADHQDRQLARPSPAGRGGVASPFQLPRWRRHAAPLGAGLVSRKSPRRSRQPTTPRPLGALHRTPQTTQHRHHRRRPRTRRLVLVVGRHGRLNRERLR